MENKINIARFKEGSRTAEVKEIWQWDYGQILRIQGLNLPSAVEIHFSLDEHGGEAARRIGITKDGVTDVPVPDSMVENESAYGDSYYFFAYIYLTDETSGNTEYKIRAKVSTRSRPEGYVSGGNDTFAEILKTVNEIAEDKVDIPAPAKVGQVLSVKATDESGKPTEFEATDPGGGVSDEKIAEAVNAYLEEHPLDETDPTVSEWAKQPEKPRYTAEEVGALPAATKIPSKTSDLQNDSGFIQRMVSDLENYYLKSETYSQEEINQKLSAIPKFSIQPVDSLPTENISETTVYLLIDNDKTGNLYSEYIYVNNTWEKLGSQSVDLTGYALKADIPTKLSELENDSGFVELDESLTDNNKAAPAGMVGELKSDISQLSEDKVDKDQGVENAGKALVIGADGNVVPGSVTLSEDETLSLLIEEDILPAVYNADGAILTDQNGNIILRY